MATIATGSRSHTNSATEAPSTMNVIVLSSISDDLRLDRLAPAPGRRRRRALDEAYERHRGDADGEVSRVYPALERMPADLFGICVVGTSGRTYAAGDADHAFTIMSVSKPFVFALACERLGPDELQRRVGVNATGLAVQLGRGRGAQPDGRTNPMVNSGALATTNLIPDWDALHDRALPLRRPRAGLDEEVYASAIATNTRNRELARLLEPARCGRRPLHAPVLAARVRPRPRGDGCDARRRRRQPGHR